MTHLKRTYIGQSATHPLMQLIISAALCVGAAVRVQAQDPRQSSADESWTATKETNVANSNPSRTTENHSKSGNRTVDRQKIEVLGPDGRYQPATETEAETVQVDAITTRTVVRTYTWDGNGRRQLSRVTEQESRTTVNGDTHLVRNTSNANLEGRLLVVQREVADTRKISPGVEETETTVSQPDSYGGFTQTEQTKEVKMPDADGSVAVKKTKLVPDGNGNWIVLEVKEKTIKDDGKSRSEEERVSYPDAEGRLSESSRTVSKQTETPTGEKTKTVETYSDYVPGYRDSSMHLNQRVTTIQKKDSGGEIITEQVEQRSSGNPSDIPKVTEKTKYVVKYGYAGTEQTKTVYGRDGGGNFYVISVETRRSNQLTPPQD
jgi:hypothetical protein